MKVASGTSGTKTTLFFARGLIFIHGKDSIQEPEHFIIGVELIKSLLMTLLCGILGSLILLFHPASAGVIYHAIDFSNYHNVRNQTRGQGDGVGHADQYPEGSQVFKGIPFEIPSGTLNTWDAGWGNPTGQVSIDITVDVNRVNQVYTIINTSWGQDGATLAEIQFIGSGGAIFTKPLVGNVDIRDWLRGNYTNSINGTTTQNVFSFGSGLYDETRLDMQIIDLPPEFENQILQKMRILDYGATNVQRIIVYGITISTIPEPADFDEDGDVDAGDYHAWQSGFGILASASHGDGDAEADGDVDGQDFLVWQRQFGLGSSVTGTIAAPEPAAIALMLVVILAGGLGVLGNQRVRSPR